MEEKVLEYLKKEIKNSKETGNHLRCDCPYCEKEGKFYINTSKMLDKNSEGNYIGSWNCFSCGESGGLYKLLKRLNNLTLLSLKEVTPTTLKKRELNTVIFQENNELLNEEIESRRLKKYSGNYLENDRKWNENQVKKYEVLEDRNYIYLSIKQFGNTVALLGRAKLKGFQPKFNNSRVNFSRIIGGFDDITSVTENIIITEGVFDKEAVDEKFNLKNNDNWACIFTFGKSIKKGQIKGIKKHKKNVKNVYILYDGDAFESSVKNAKQIKHEFANVFVIDLKEYGDPDDISEEMLKKLFKENKLNISLHLEKREL